MYARMYAHTYTRTRIRAYARTHVRALFIFTRASRTHMRTHHIHTSHAHDMCAHITLTYAHISCAPRHTYHAHAHPLMRPHPRQINEAAASRMCMCRTSRSHELTCVNSSAYSDNCQVNRAGRDKGIEATAGQPPVGRRVAIPLKSERQRNAPARDPAPPASRGLDNE